MSDHYDNGKYAKHYRKLQPAFSLLLDAFEYADDAKSDVWEFAVRIRSLQRLRLNELDFRWLVRKGYVEHAREITLPGDQMRQFRPEGKPVFSKGTCFVLTKDGVSKARCFAAEQTPTPDDDSASTDGNGNANGKPVQRSVPHWDEETRELRLAGRMIKRFKWQAANQELVLNTFQEEGWPTRIDDPLPPQPEQDPKRRLSDTIKCLNGKQQNSLIRFHGDGTGEGVIWELVNGNTNGQE